MPRIKLATLLILEASKIIFLTCHAVPHTCTPIQGSTCKLISAHNMGTRCIHTEIHIVHESGCYMLQN